MKPILITGDIHARVDAITYVDNLAKELGIETVVQVGDWGGHWRGLNEVCPVDKYFATRTEGPTWYTCGGNHENYTAIEQLPEVNGWREIHPEVHFASRPAFLYELDMSWCFMGGAESTDCHHRLPEFTWWERETPTDKEMYEFAAVLKAAKPEVLITHDVHTNHRPQRDGYCAFSNKTSDHTARGLTAAYDAAPTKPQWWFYGHHHDLSNSRNAETAFMGCGLHGQGYILVPTSTGPFPTKFDMRGMPVKLVKENVEKLLAS